MAYPDPRHATPDNAPQLPRWVIVLILTCCVIEIAIMAADILGWPQARRVTFVLGGFWSGLMWEGPGGIYPGQGIVMFATYGLIHAGLLHLAMNMISLGAVARELWRLMDARQIAMIYVASQIAAALLFGWMQPLAGPMVGASGAVFGLAGALVSYGGLWRWRSGRAMRPVLNAVAIIVGLNFGLTLLMPGIAWEAHLGGAAAGLLIGAVLGILRQPQRRH